MDGTHQLYGTIMFPAEVSTPAAQVLRGRAAKQKCMVRNMTCLSSITQRSLDKTVTQLVQKGQLQHLRCFSQLKKKITYSTIVFIHVHPFFLSPLSCFFHSPCLEPGHCGGIATGLVTGQEQWPAHF